MLQSLLAETVQYNPGERLLILNSASDPCVPHLAKRAGELVLAEDSVAAYAQAQTALRGLGRDGAHFRQVAFHEYTACEEPGTMDVAVMNILYQPNSMWMQYGVQLAAYALKSGGRLYIAGAKDRGILSLAKRVQELFGNLETQAISKGQRVIYALKREQRANVLVAPHLAAFADGKMDEGTALLLEALEVHITENALDLGCGSGLLGAHIAERASRGNVTLVDASLTSVAAARRLLAERALTNTRVLASDGIQAVSQQRFSLVATNPPFHLGGIQTTAVAERFIREAAQVLLPRGRLYLVANRFLKYEPTLHTCFGEVAEIAGNSRFKVLRATGRPLPLEFEEILEEV
ncbi:MAG TPA: methyltransferase [Ktedonobacteraceae bacterium]